MGVTARGWTRYPPRRRTLPDVQKMMRHSSPVATAIYSEADPAMRAAIERRGAAVQ